MGFATQEQKEAPLALGAYVILSNGEISYMQAENANAQDNYHFVSYSDIIKE